jgi:hypothetical protein
MGTENVKTTVLTGPPGWMQWERRCLYTLMRAILPLDESWPTFDASKHDAFWTLWKESAPLSVKFGFRAAVWIMTFIAPLLIARPVPFFLLSPANQTHLLHRCDASNIALFRQLIELLKTLTCLIYFQGNDVQQYVREKA